jgi:hypothetical protein
VALVVSFRIIPRKNTPRETFRINSPTRSLEEVSKRVDDRARRKDANRAAFSFTTTDDERYPLSPNTKGNTDADYRHRQRTSLNSLIN